MPLPLLTMVKWVLKSKISRQMPNSNLNSHFISETKIDEKDEKDEKALQKYCMVVYHEG
jgi:hypothetical protein